MDETQSTQGAQGFATVNEVSAEDEVGVCSMSEMSERIATNPQTMPGKPGQPVVSQVTHNSTQLNWSRPEWGAHNIQYYSVLYCRIDCPSPYEWKKQSIVDAQEDATVSGLAAKAVYRFKVRAEGEDGIYSESEMSDQIVTLPHPISRKPGKPMASKVTHNSIQLHWSGPHMDSQDTTFYSVLYRRMDDPSSRWQTQSTHGAQAVATVSGLAPNAVYCCKVRVEGEGSESEMSDPIATNPHSTPGELGQPMASEVTHNSVQLSWSGPEFDSHDIKCYTVDYRQMDDPSAQWQTQSTQSAQEVARVSGLAANSVYCFKVHAEDEAGVCSESEISDPIATKPRPIPGKPTASKVTHNSIELSWSSPEEDITILYRRMDDPSSRWQTQSTQGAQPHAKVSGLVANTVYCFKVRAVGEDSVFSDSETSDLIATKPRPIPGKPGKPTASKVTHNSIELSWSSPEEDITILYRRMDDPSSNWQTQSAHGAQAVATVSGLAANAVYCCKVRVEGGGSESEMSDPIVTHHHSTPGKPGQPMTSEVTHNSVQLSWSGPEFGCHDIKCYTVVYRQMDDPSSQWQKQSTQGAQEVARVSGLAANSVYCFKVHAEDEAGVCSESEMSDPIATKPHATAGKPVSNLAPNTKYCFKVRAEDEACISPESKIIYDIRTLPLDSPPSQPGKPYMTDVTHDIIELKWDKPSCDTQGCKCYTVSYYEVDDHDFPDKWKTEETADLQESITVTGLKPSAVYCFKVRAESDAGCSSYSESSDPIQLYAPPAPGQPGKPTASDDDIIHNHIFLKWSKPAQGGEYVKHYSISYRKKSGPENQWQTQLSDGARTTLSVSGLNPKTEYCFKVHAVNDSGISTDSEVSAFQTKEKVRLAEGMLSSAIMMEQGPPAIYKLQLQEVAADESKQIKKCSIGNADTLIPAEEKVIMVLGATGAGKTTLINGMANYLLGVQWEDEFRFKVIVDEGDKETSGDTGQAHSQTKWITAYTFHHQKGSPLPYTLTIIDTPGFGDTGGLERDHRITAQIKHFFSLPPPDGIDHLNAIGFVTQASLARLTPTQKYIFDSILAVFGKDIASNIFMMATFADGGDPPVKAAIKAANIPSCDLFKFNNSSLYAGCSDMFGKMFWEMGLFSFEKFFAHLIIVDTRSLRLTRHMLDEREHLEVIMQGLLPQIKTIMSTVDELQQEEKVLEQLQLEASDLGVNFTYSVTAIHQRKVALPSGEYTTNCRKCNRTCHYPCRIPDNEKKWGCAAMNWREAGKNSLCQVCPGGCEWQLHCINNFRIEDYEEEEERTLENLLKRFNTITSDKNALKTTVDEIKQQVKYLKRKVFESICEAQQILARLDEIALKPNSLNELDYIDLLIETEKQECKPGYGKRIEYLHEARHNAELIYQIDEPVDAPQWLKESVQKAKEQMIRRRHPFQQQILNQHPHPKPAQPTRDVSRKEQMVRHTNATPVELPPTTRRARANSSGNLVGYKQQQHSRLLPIPIHMQPLPVPTTEQEAFTSTEQTVRYQPSSQQQHSYSYHDSKLIRPSQMGRREASTGREDMARYQQQQHTNVSHCFHSIPTPSSQMPRRETSAHNVQMARHQHWQEQQPHSNLDHYDPCSVSAQPPQMARRSTFTGGEQLARHQDWPELQQRSQSIPTQPSQMAIQSTFTGREQLARHQDWPELQQRSQSIPAQPSQMAIQSTFTGGEQLARHQDWPELQQRSQSIPAQPSQMAIQSTFTGREQLARHQDWPELQQRSQSIPAQPSQMAIQSTFTGREQLARHQDWPELQQRSQSIPTQPSQLARRSTFTGGEQLARHQDWPEQQQRSQFISTQPSQLVRHQDWPQQQQRSQSIPTQPSQMARRSTFTGREQLARHQDWPELQQRSQSISTQPSQLVRHQDWPQQQQRSQSIPTQPSQMARRSTFTGREQLARHQDWPELQQRSQSIATQSLQMVRQSTSTGREQMVRPQEQQQHSNLQHHHAQTHVSKKKSWWQF